MPEPTENSLLADVASYYSEKLRAHGDTPRGVDWNGVESQTRRFAELSRIFAAGERFSVNDLGCGYGAFRDYLLAHYPKSSYLGIDVSGDMIEAAKQRFSSDANARFACADTPDAHADFSVASGIFNVKLDRSLGEWQDYFFSTLDLLDRTSDKGFAFNCLTSYSDKEKMQGHLYYANPCEVFDHCKRHYSRQVALLHDYGLYEFTILVRKQA